MSHPSRPILLLAALALCAAVLAACGGGDENPSDLLKQTFSGDKQITSGNLTVGFDLRVEGNAQLSQPVSVKLSGPFQSQGKGKLPKFDFNLSFTGGGQSISAGAVSTGSQGFLEFQGQAYAVPAQVFEQFRQGFEQAQRGNRDRKDQPSLASLGLDPLKWLRDPKVVGDEEVGGTQTTHITAGVNVPKFLDDVNTVLRRAGDLGVQGAGNQVPRGLTEQQRGQVQRALRDVRFDVWTGKDDKTMRRLTVNLGLNTQGRRGSLRVAVEIADLNQEQNIEAPSGAKPLSDLQQQLQGLAGGLGGLGGGGGSSGSGGSGSSGGSGPSGRSPGASGGGSEQLQAYTECLQKAGGDAAKAQKCAGLLRTP